MFKSTRKILILVALMLYAGATTLEENIISQPFNHDHQMHGPMVGAVDRLCSVSNTANGTCIISQQLLRFTFDFYYVTTNSLVFDNSILRCFTVDYLPCNIQIVVQGQSSITLINGSQFIGRQILIDAQSSQVILRDSSQISASGQSYNTNGTQGGQGMSKGGASFVGQGGSCPDTGTKSVYGNFNSLPDFRNISNFQNQLGSIGNYGDAETAGGGRIVILADSININGNGAMIQANAEPFANSAASISYNLTGGSGGYIYIRTTNKINNDQLNDQFTIEAQGGYGTWGNFGGSGGSIVFDGNFTLDEEQVTVQGGLAINSTQWSDGCGNGASGTLWYRTKDRLYVDNEDVVSSKSTVLSVPQNGKKGVSPQTIASSILISGQANVRFQNVNEWLLIDNIEMTDSVTVGFVSSLPQITLQIGSQAQISRSSLFDFSNIPIFNINSTSNTTLNLGSITYGRIIKIYGGYVNLFGTVSLPTTANQTFISQSYVVFDSTTIQLRSSAAVYAAFILMQADGPITLDGGSLIQSYITNTCNTQVKDSNLFTCVPFKSRQTTLTEETFLATYNARFGAQAKTFKESMINLVQNFTIYLVSFENITGIMTSIQGPRVGLCAPDVQLIQSVVNSSAQGCQSDQGLGAGKADGYCAGTGGAHGGHGGYGAPYFVQKKTLCDQYISSPYYYKEEARYEGSGGGSGISGAGLGGSGGGIIWISSIGTVSLYDSSLLASGGDGLPGLGGSFASGGGAGGSIQIITKNIAGNGIIQLSGGLGSIGGGGGGSGGRLVTNFLQGYNSSNSESQSMYWSGSLNIFGGSGGVIGDFPHQVPSNKTSNSSIVIPNFGPKAPPSIDTNNTFSGGAFVPQNKTNITVPQKTTNNSTVNAPQKDSPLNMTNKNVTNSTTQKNPVNMTLKNNTKNTTQKTPQVSIVFTPQQDVIVDIMGDVNNAIDEITPYVINPFNQTQSKNHKGNSTIKTLTFDGLPVIAGNGDSGTTSSTKCFGGYTGPFCKPCPAGTFKYDYGFGVCQPCQNKPINSFYDKIAQKSFACSFQCITGLEKVDVNPLCQSSMDIQVKRAGGTLASLGIFFALLIMALMIWIIMAARSKCIRRNNVNAYQTMYEDVEVILTTEADEIEGLVEKDSLNFKDCDIWTHTHRMYLIGENSISFPWYITKDFPNDALSEVNKDRFLYFIKKEQWTLDWTTMQKQVYYIFRLFFPYASDYIHRAIRRLHFRNFTNTLYSTFDESHWEDRVGRSLRVSCDNKDSQLAYIDFVDFQKKKKDYVGPKFPMTFLLAGNGALSTPYYFNFTEDPLAKSLVYLNKDQLKTKLPQFFENLNTLLDKLSFFKLNRQTMKDLSDIITWIELGNKTLFNPLDTQMTLYIFENSYMEVEGGSFKQRRRSMPIEQLTFEAFPDLYKSLITFVQMKLLNKKSEIRFGLVFKPTNITSRKLMEQRVKKLLEAKSQNLQDEVGNFNQSSVSMLYTADDEDSQEFLRKPIKSQTYKNNETNLGELNRQGEISQSLLSESKMETSEVMIHGAEYESKIKIVDKSKRAFDISADSTRALELALQKDRKKWGNLCTRIKSVTYGLWLMLMKYHGRPPGGNSLNKWFLMYSLVLTLEMLLSMIFFVHVFNPAHNMATFGFPYLFVLPGLTLIAPFWGLLAIPLGSPQMFKSYSNMNATLVTVNYPLTLLAQLWVKDEPFYIFVLIMLILNKVLISFFGGKVRQHFANPGYAKNYTRLEHIMAHIPSTTADSFEQVALTPAERAARLVSQGRPIVNRSTVSDQEMEILNSDDDEEEDSFGIVSTNKLRQPLPPMPNPNSDDEDDEGYGLTTTNKK